MPKHEQSTHWQDAGRTPDSSHRRRTTDYARPQQNLPTTGWQPHDAGKPANSWELLPSTVQQHLFPPDQRPDAPQPVPDAALAQLQHRQQQNLHQDYERDLRDAREGLSFETPEQVAARYRSQWDRVQQTYPEGQASQPGFVPAEAPGSGQASHAQPFFSATPGAWVFPSEGTAPGHSSSALPSWQRETFSEAGLSGSQPSVYAPAESFFSASAALPGAGDQGTLAGSSLHEGMATTSLTGQRTESRELNSSLFQRVTLQRDRASQLLDEASRTWLDEAFPGYHEAIFSEVRYDKSSRFTARGDLLWSEFCQMKQWRLEDYDAQLGRLESDRAQWRTRNQWIENEVQKLERNIQALNKQKVTSSFINIKRKERQQYRLRQNELNTTKISQEKIQNVEKVIENLHEQRATWEVAYETLSSRPDPQQLQQMLEDPQEEANPTKRARKSIAARRREQSKAYHQSVREKNGISHSTVYHYMDLLREHAIQLSGQTSDEGIDFSTVPINRFIREYYSATGDTLSDINEDAKREGKLFPVYFHEVKAKFEAEHPSLPAQQTGSKKSETKRISAAQMQEKTEKIKQRKYADTSKYRDIIRKKMGITYNTLRKYIQELVEYGSQSPEKKSTLSPEDIKRFAREYYEAKRLTLKHINRDAKREGKLFPVYFHEVKAAFEAEQDAQKRHTAPPTQPEIQHDASPSPSEDEESASE